MFEILSITGSVQFVRTLSPILDGKEQTFLICLFFANRQLQKKTVTTYLSYYKITISTVPNLATHLLFKQFIRRNHSARAKYFLVLDSIGFENLKQMEIQFNSEKVHT
jgi:hypothetical protein